MDHLATSSSSTPNGHPAAETTSPLKCVHGFNLSLACAYCDASANSETKSGRSRLTEIADLQARILRLESDLNECREFLDGQIDVVDGDYGEQAPNRAMVLCSMIDETLGDFR
jgi:hypothetical protein